MSGATAVFVVVEERVHSFGHSDRQLRMQSLPLRVSSLWPNSFLDEVTMIKTATREAICMQKRALVGWDFPGFECPTVCGASRCSSCITSAFSCLSDTANPCGSKSWCKSDWIYRWRHCWSFFSAGLWLLYRHFVRNGRTFTPSRASSRS